MLRRSRGMKYHEFKERIEELYQALRGEPLTIDEPTIKDFFNQGFSVKGFIRIFA